jgi:hypothetical protein
VNGTGGNVGGLVGYNCASITDCNSSGSVSGRGNVGGLVGYNNWAGITNSYSSASVNGTADNVGGLAGSNFNGSITNSYSSGSVNGTGGYVGGLAGSNFYGSITNSYSSGSVNGTGGHIGGLVGSTNDSGSILSSFWDVQTSGQDASEGGTGKTTAEMQRVETFLGAGWDFVGEVANGTCNYWQIAPGSYPQLHWQGGNRPLMPEGQGTAEQPYLIRDARDLGTVWFEPLACYRLEESIDLLGIRWSVAVIPWFGGKFDGNGHTISHLTITGQGYLGLFGQLLSSRWFTARVVSLAVVDANITGSDQFGRGGVGGVAGGSDDSSVIASSFSKGSVSGGIFVGGLVGKNFGSITTSSSEGSVAGEGYVGGLVGYNHNGRNNDDSITICCSSGSVGGGDSVGGLVGRNDGTVRDCYSTGAITGGNVVGGLMGENWGATVTQCYSTGAVTGGNVVGGLMGENWGGTVAQCYSTGAVSGIEPVGGLVGYNGDAGVYVYSSFWDVETSGQTNSAGGTGKTTAEMQTAKTFLDAGWDFVYEIKNGTEDTWFMPENGYPKLVWQTTDAMTILTVPTYRFRSPATSHYFYTTSESEKQKLIDKYSDAWTYEGLAFRALPDDVEPNSLPVYRFWSSVLGVHFHTIKESERDELISKSAETWVFEGIAFYAYPEGGQPAGTSPVYRFWSDKFGCYFYTISEAERDECTNDPAHAWTCESVAWYAYK